MRRLILAAALVLTVAPLAAQQQQTSPSQLALQIDNAVNGMAQSIEQLQAELAKAQARVKELEDKLAKQEPAK